VGLGDGTRVLGTPTGSEFIFDLFVSGINLSLI
jgi:hypothetical protein